MSDQEIAKEAAEHLWVDLPDRETCTPEEWHKAVEPLILKAISQVDVQGLVDVLVVTRALLQRIFDGVMQSGSVTGVVYTPDMVEKALKRIDVALSAHPTSEAQCEAGMEAKGFHRVLPADVVGVLRHYEWIGYGPATQTSYCLWCLQNKKNGHAAECEVDALLKKYTSAPSLPAEAIALAYGIIEDAEADRFIYRTHETMMAGTKSYPLAKAVLKKYIPEEQDK